MSLLGRLAHLVYPRYCELCRAPSASGPYHSLCSPCASELDRVGPAACATCDETFSGALEESFACPNCTGETFAFRYNRSALRLSDSAMDLVYGLKYQRHIYLARDLAALLATTLDRIPEMQEYADNWVFTPVPLHRRRKSKRGFNQAAELCHHLSALTSIPTEHALRRVLPTDSQTQLSRKERLNNLKHAFKARPRAPSLIGKCVVLVDDVFTTGSTAHACAKVLTTDLKAEMVVVLTVMRG